MKQVKLKSVAAVWSLTALLCFAIRAVSQPALPVIRTGNGPVDIRDGLHLKKGYWLVIPDRRPDLYYVEIPEQQHTVTFITDQDSAQFKVSYGKTYDFILLRNGKDSCYTRIVARYKDKGQLLKAALPSTAPDTLHFSFGANKKIYLEGQLNGSPVQNCQLDLGAGGVVVNKAAISKLNIHFDKMSQLSNSDGVNKVPLSSYNHLQFDHLSWDSIPIVVAENMQPEEDLLLSNSLFKNKVLEIDNERRLLIISDTLSADSNGYTRLPMILDQGILPYIPVGLKLRNSTHSGFVMFDTGARTTILNSGDISLVYRLLIQLASLGGLEKNARPSFVIGKYTLNGFEYKTRDMGEGATLKAILGIDLLRRFNIILDNRHGYLYLKPNALWNTSYGKPNEYYLVRGFLILLLALFAYGIIRKRKKRKIIKKQS